MRPIAKGPCPTKNGTQIVFSNYRKARPYLMERIGAFCSYCEIPLPSGPDVEHVRPKSHDPGLAMSWNNFLLACRNCNSNKGTTPVVLAHYYWPDMDNTRRPFEFPNGGPPRPTSALTAAERAIATQTIRLTGLHKKPGPTNHTDFRSRRRERVWREAQACRAALLRRNEAQDREFVVQVATGHGFWSIWMEIFHDMPEVKRRLIEAFEGTAQDCFDVNCDCVPRPGGQI